MEQKSKQAVIFLAGEVRNIEKIRSLLHHGNYEYYAADAGYLLAERIGVIPDKILGDFDSAKKPNTEELLVFPSEKDQTDSEIALELAVSNGCREIWMLAPFGGRIDHTIANLCLLETAHEKGIDLKLYDGENLVYLLNDGSYSVSSEYRYVSFFPWKNKAIISLSGFKYPLDHYELLPQKPIGVSNEPLEGPRIDIHNGLVLCVCVEKNQEEL